MEPKIIEKKEISLIGSVYYGNPFHSAKGWTTENEIGKTWKRFMQLCIKNEAFLKKFVIAPKIAYEVHIAPEAPEDKKEFYVFVGVEVKNLSEMPLEMFGKILPAAKYALFTFKWKQMISGGHYIYDEWLPKSGYKEAYPYQIQVYNEESYKGVNSEESEIEYWVPIK